MNNTSFARALPEGRRYGIVSSVYNVSLRPVVLFLSGLAAVWALALGISSFRLFGENAVKNVPGLQTIAMVLGILYMVTMVIELFGVTAATLQRVVMVRLYSYLSILASVSLLAGSLVQIVVHFTKKSSLISECTSTTTGDTVFVSWGLFGPSRRTNLTPQEAMSFCQDSWNHDSWADIVAFIIEIVLAVIYVAVCFGYYRQLIDPTSPVNVARVPRTQGYPQQYNPPYAGQQFYPPPGPPPNQGYYDQSFVPPYDANKLPGYGENDRDAKYDGDHDAKYDNEVRYGDTKFSHGYDEEDKDPFSDFDGPSRRRSPEYEERDLTSRPRPGERETF